MTGIADTEVDAGHLGVSAALSPLRFGWARRLAGRAALLRNYRQIKQRYDAFALETILGVPIVCTPGVFNPKLMRTGEFFASHISATELARDSSVLDMGTGSGVCAMFAARRARRVVAVDVNPAAIRCATANAWLNGVQDIVEVRHGDLFAPLHDERFDLVLFNPPFLRGTPVDDLDRAWRSEDVAERFADGLRSHLKPSGHALMLLSTFGDSARFVDALRKQDLSMSVVATRKYVNEKLTIVRVHALRHSGAGAIR